MPKTPKNYNQKFTTIKSNPDNISKVLNEIFEDSNKTFKDIKEIAVCTYLVVYNELKSE